MGHLMTATLLSSFKWMQDAPASWAQRAREDFFSKVRRTDVFAPTPEIERGMRFERIICDSCNTLDEDSFMLKVRDIYVDEISSDPDTEQLSVTEKESLLTRILNVCNVMYHQCKGGEQQVKIGKDIEACGEQFYLFGYIDVLQPSTILDIKTCTKFREDKYRDSIQHSIYQYATGIPEFKYIVADYNGSRYPSMARVVETSIADISEAERRIKGRLTNLVHYLKENNLWEDYINLFCRGK